MGDQKIIFTLSRISVKIDDKDVVGKSIPYVGAVMGAAIDTAQMVQIIQYAEVFYCKRFILEKESRILALGGNLTTVVDAQLAESESDEEMERVLPAESADYVSVSNVMDEIAKAKQLFDAGILTKQ